MKYYSEILKKNFDTEKACIAAEKEFAEKNAAEEAAKKKAAQERKTRAQQVEAAHNDMVQAQKRYNELLKDFLKDYGSYHMTVSEPDPLAFLDELFKIW